MNISTKQVNKLIEMAEAVDEKGAPANFNALPADKAVITRDSFQKLLHDLSDARARVEALEEWQDIAVDLAEELLLTKAYDSLEDAGEDSALWKFHHAATADEEPY